MDTTGSTTFYSGSITPTIFSEDYKRTLYIVLYTDIATATTDDYHIFYLNVPSALGISGETPKGLSSSKETIFNFTITSTSKIKE